MRGMPCCMMHPSLFTPLFNNLIISSRASLEKRIPGERARYPWKEQKSVSRTIAMRLPAIWSTRVSVAQYALEPGHQLSGHLLGAIFVNEMSGIRYGDGGQVADKTGQFIQVVGAEGMVL